MFIWQIFSRLKLKGIARSVGVSLLSILLFQGAMAQTPVAKTYVLNNGMRVVVKEDHRSPNVVHMVWYKVGSMDEVSGTTGLAHVMEHMMFKGTPKYPNGKFSKLVSQLGGQDNAFTNTDYTAYFQKVPVASLEKMMDLESDRMQHLQFTANDFKKEIKVIMEERRWRTEDRPEGVLGETLRASAFIEHPYHHPVIGWMNDLKNMTADDVRGWYQRWYAPNNATLVVVGDVKPEQVLKMAQKYYGNVPTKRVVASREQLEPEQKGIRRLVVQAPAENPVVVMAYKMPSLKDVEKDNDVYALDVLASVLDGYDNARLSATMVREKQTAISVSADYSALSRGPALFVLEATPNKGYTIDLMEKQLREAVQKIADEGISEKELQRVKSQLMAAQIYKRDTIFGQAMEIGLLEMTGIGHEKIDRMIEKLKAVTAKDVQRVAKAYFKDEVLTVAVLDPQKIQKTIDKTKAESEPTK